MDTRVCHNTYFRVFIYLHKHLTRQLGDRAKEKEGAVPAAKGNWTKHLAALPRLRPSGDMMEHRVIGTDSHFCSATNPQLGAT